jgi:oligopeptide transport system permease protein
MSEPERPDQGQPNPEPRPHESGYADDEPPTEGFFGSANTAVTDDLGAAEESQSEVPEQRRASLRADAWHQLRRRPMFWFAIVIIAVFVTMALVPWLFADPDAVSQQAGACQLARSLQPPSSEFWFGTDQQGCDVYARTIYGARASITVGVLVTLGVSVIGVIIGTTAGYFGGWADSVLSRIVDIFFALPLFLAGLIFLSVLQLPGIWGVVIAMTLFGWTQIARIARSSVISTKSMDYVQAARALGASNDRIIRHHVLPNSLTPVIVVAMISLGGFITAEATFSFLGIGVQPPTISWGVMIAEAQTVFVSAPWTLLFPAGALLLTVLSFILLGDAVRDALDPKLQ